MCICEKEKETEKEKEPIKQTGKEIEKENGTEKENSVAIWLFRNFAC